jgi:YegS/Rv2252/BmrU family lipid kinase
VRARRLRQRIERAFAALGEEIELRETTGPGHATALAREAAAGQYRVVCAVGGDGTLAETATALAGTGTPLAVVPRGTANQVAANLHIPTNVEAAIQVAVRGEPVDLDVGVIEGRIFALAAGAGFDAAVMARATRSLKERWGFGAYIYAALKEAMPLPRTHYRIVADGRELDVDAMSVLIANVGAIYSTFPPVCMPMTPEPELAWCDGLLDVVILEPSTVPRFAGLLARLALRGFGGEGLVHLRAREVRVETDPVVPFQVDGDLAGQTPLSAAAMPAALRILRPRRPK